ncbi:MAG: indole-3-glycerol phosphate synthase TrpC [Anaerolineales bacterium]|nr:indole-3-glycerol phosphate synthase TrpC [Anaerolineales bacterium]
MSILEEIFAHKRIEVQKRKEQVSEVSLRNRLVDCISPPDFLKSLTNTANPAPRLIAEVKKQSPSKGLLVKDFNSLELANIYAENGAAAISVLTDEEFFGGRLEYLQSISGLQTGIPLLRKEFIFDPYQLVEAQLAGASAVLLITAMLGKEQLSSLIAEAQALSLASLVEVHDKDELQTALDCGATLIGVNNRNLHDFSVSLETSICIANERPEGIILVAESGIKTLSDVHRLAEAGVDAILVGESLVTAPDIAAQVRLFSQTGMK